MDFGSFTRLSRRYGLVFVGLSDDIQPSCTLDSIPCDENIFEANSEVTVALLLSPVDIGSGITAINPHRRSQESNFGGLFDLAIDDVSGC